MKKIYSQIRALHPPILLAILCFIVFSILLGDLSISSVYFYLGIVGVIIFSFDALNRFSEFKRTEKLYSKKSSTRKIIQLLEKSKFSWCTREMAKERCRKISERKYKIALAIYRRKYKFRFWHFFPVGTFKRDSVFLKKKFWQKTFLSFKTKKKTKSPS